MAIQPGGKPVIQKFFLSLMNPGDEVLIPAPGYPIYESIVAFHGGKPVLYPYREGPRGFSLDLDDLEGRITPATRFLVLNNLQNPTGAEEDERGLAALSRIVLSHDLLVLCDEAYFDMRYSGTSCSLASFPGHADRCLILYTFSKKYAMTGWRLGAAIGPQDLVDCDRQAQRQRRVVLESLRAVRGARGSHGSAGRGARHHRHAAGTPRSLPRAAQPRSRACAATSRTAPSTCSPTSRR